MKPTYARRKPAPQTRQASFSHKCAPDAHSSYGNLLGKIYITPFPPWAIAADMFSSKALNLWFCSN